MDAYERLENLLQRLVTKQLDAQKDKAILDAVLEDGVVYMTNMQTNEIIYLNKNGKKLFGDAEGKVCYEIFQHLTENIIFLPLRKSG